MPELPEVETVRRSLEPRLVGRRIERAVISDYRRVIATPTPEEFVARTKGLTITRLDRRGKFIVVRFDSGESMTIHLRMTGELSLVDPAVPVAPHMHLHLALDNGQELRYYDIRKFGRWSLLTSAQYRLFDDSLGVEPFDPGLDCQRFTEMLHGRRRILKPLLLDQTFIAGIGNIYADEALFRSGIHPRRRSNELSECETGRLLGEIRAVLEESIQHRGTTLRNYRDGDGQPGENLARLRIYSRDAGDPCPTCGGPVVREVIGQRGTKLCPVCQPLNVSR